MSFVAVLAVAAPAWPEEPVASPVCLPGHACEAWVSVFDHPGGREFAAHSGDIAAATASSPSGDRFYVAGSSYDADTLDDYAVATFDTSDGTRRWAARYDGPASVRDVPFAVAASPLGDRVYVTGIADIGAREDMATVAYDGASGAELWRARYEPRTSAGIALAASHDGGNVYVAGVTLGADGFDTVTVAYDAATGAPAWTAVHDGPGAGEDWPVAIALAPDDSAVYVGGHETAEGGTDAVTIAYDPATGEKRWIGSYDGGAYDATGDPFRFRLGRSGPFVAVSSDGRRVYSVGVSERLATESSESTFDALVIAHDAATGERMWVDRDPAPVGDLHANLGVAAAPVGDDVFVIGVGSRGVQKRLDAHVRAYEGISGETRWATQLAGSLRFSEVPTALALSRDGRGVYVTGYSGSSIYGCVPAYCAGGPVVPPDIVTAAFDARDGARSWHARFNTSTVTADALVPVGIAAGEAVTVGATAFYGEAAIGHRLCHLFCVPTGIGASDNRADFVAVGYVD